MIRVYDLMEANRGENGNKVAKESLNNLFMESLETIVDTVDDEYNKFIKLCLESPSIIDDISIRRKIKEIEATDYKIDYGMQDDKDVCHICGDRGVKLYDTVRGLNACTVCLGLEERSDRYRHSKESVEKIYLELKELTKDINNIEDFIGFANKNSENPDFDGIELDGYPINKSYCESNSEKIKEYINGELKADTLRFEYKIMYVYMNPETFELKEEVCVWDENGEDVCDWVNYKDFKYEYHEESTIS